MSEKRALALLSDVEKSNYNSDGTYYQISPLMFQKVNEKIDGKSGNVKILLLYLIFQQQNGGFHPAEATILSACGFDHSQYVRARTKLIELGFIEYEPFKYIKLIYKKIME